MISIRGLSLLSELHGVTLAYTRVCTNPSCAASFNIKQKWKCATCDLTTARGISVTESNHESVYHILTLQDARNRRAARLARDQLADSRIDQPTVFWSLIAHRGYCHEGALKDWQRKITRQHFNDLTHHEIAACCRVSEKRVRQLHEARRHAQLWLKQ